MAPKAHKGSKYFPLCGHDRAYNSESKRLSSYVNWPADHPVSTIKLAEEGFVYTGQADEVRCAFCHYTKRDWGQGLKPEEVHRNESPTCPLYDDSDDNPFRGPSNVPIPVVNVRNARLILAASPDTLLQPAGQPGPQQASDEEDRAEDLFARYTHEEMGVELRRPSRERAEDVFAGRMHAEMGVNLRPPHQESAGEEQYPTYRSLKKRAASFQWDGFPVHLLSPLTLSRLGFFSAGAGDLVICFFCGVMLDSWQAPDDPAIEHARHCPACRQLLRVKGPDFVRTVQNELVAIGHAN